MSDELVIQKIEMGLLVVTPSYHEGITANRIYVVEKVVENKVFIRNDFGEVKPYALYSFMEADLYFTMSLFSSLISIFRLGNKAYK